MSDPKITLDPDPPIAGKDLTIGYTGTLPVTLQLTWDPAGTPTSVTLTTDSPTVTIKVPANAVALQVVDPTGDAPYRDVPVKSP